MEPDAFTEMFFGAAEEAQPAEMSELTATMNNQQLTSSLQQMVQTWKELQGMRQRERIRADPQPVTASCCDQ